MTEQICPFMSLAATKIRRIFGIPVHETKQDNYTESYEDFVMCQETKCKAWMPTTVIDEVTKIDGYCKLIERR